MPALSRRSYLPRPIGLGALAARLAVTVLIWQERARQRAMLARMDDHLLRDIGLTRSAAAGEWVKPFWRP